MGDDIIDDIIDDNLMSLGTNVTGGAVSKGAFVRVASIGLATFLVATAFFWACLVVLRRIFYRLAATRPEGFVAFPPPYLSVFHKAVPPHEVAPMTISDAVIAADEELGGAVGSLVKQGYFTLDDDAYGVRTVSAAEFGWGGELLLMATSWHSFFLMAGSTPPPRSLADIFTEKGRTFVCASPAARWMLDLVAAAHGVANTGSLNVLVSSSGGDPNPNSIVTHCTLVRPGAAHDERHRYVYPYVDDNFRAVLAVHAPFVQVRGVYVRRVASAATSDPRVIRELACVEDLLVTPSALTNTAGVRLLGRAVLGHRSALARTAYYARYFPCALLDNNTNNNDPKLPKLRLGPSRALLHQQDNSKPMTLEVAQPLKGGLFGVFFRGRARFILLDASVIDGVPLRLGDRLRLAGQPRRQENGVYTICRFFAGKTTNKIYTLLCSPPALFVLRNGGSVARERERLGLLTGDDDKALVVLLDTDEHLLDQLLGAVPWEGAELHDSRPDGPSGGYTEICMGDPSALTEEACAARGRVWDRPCVTDAECPFFTANNRLRPVARGGCMDSGYCEMPYGVRSVSFRKAEGSPFCRGCPPGVPLAACCEEQPEGTRKYAFVGDEFDEQW